MKLAEYLRTNNLSDAQFGELIGVNRSTVGRWCDAADPVMPQKAHMESIVKATGGEVTAVDFLPARYDPSAPDLTEPSNDAGGNSEIEARAAGC